MQTSDPDIYAGGDCVAIPNLITGKPFVLALGSLANRQGRVIGTNAASDDGKAAAFHGAVGTWCVKIFKMSACGTGLTIERAKAFGFDAISASLEQLDRAHFYPEKHMMTLELVVERGTRRVLGIQGVCEDGDASRPASTPWRPCSSSASPPSTISPMPKSPMPRPSPPQWTP